MNLAFYYVEYTNRLTGTREKSRSFRTIAAAKRAAIRWYAKKEPLVKEGR